MALADYIVVSPGKLYVAPVGEANPDETTVAYGAAWGGNWVDLGNFPEGSPLTVRFVDNIFDVYGERDGFKQKQSRTRREAEITGVLQAHSIVNWEYLLDATADAAVAAGASQKGYQELPFGAPAQVSQYKWGVEIFLAETDNTQQPQRWFFHKGSITANSEVQYGKGAQAGMGFMVACFGDTGQTAGEELGIFQQVTDAATA